MLLHCINLIYYFLGVVIWCGPIEHGEYSMALQYGSLSCSNQSLQGGGRGTLLWASPCAVLALPHGHRQGLAIFPRLILISEMGVRLSARARGLLMCFRRQPSIASVHLSVFIWGNCIWRDYGFFIVIHKKRFASANLQTLSKYGS